VKLKNLKNDVDFGLDLGTTQHNLTITEPNPTPSNAGQANGADAPEPESQQRGPNRVAAAAVSTALESVYEGVPSYDEDLPR